MTPDLDKLKTELPRELEELGFVVFHALSRADEDENVVVWDAVQRPDYRDFLDTAKRLGVKVMVLNVRPFEEASIRDLQGEIESLDVSPSERRDLDRRLKALSPYAGFTANLELSYDFNGIVYVFEHRSEFMNEFLDILAEVDAGIFPPMEFDDEPEDPSGGSFYSRN